MIEIGRGLLGDRRQHSEAHQNVALAVEQDELAFRPGQRQPEPKPGMAAHRRVAERHVEGLPVGKTGPVAAAAPRHDNRVAAMPAKDFQRLGDAHHGPVPLAVCRCQS